MIRTLWNQILSDISSTTDQQCVETWFRPLIPDPSSSPSQLMLVAPNQFACDFLEENYKDTVLAVSKKFSDSIVSVRFIPAQPTPQPNSQSVQPPPPQARSFPGLSSRFTFDSFVVGAGNEFAKSAAIAVAEAPGKTKFNPLLIYGGVGLGKTHLIQAIGNLVGSVSSSNNVNYITSEEFYLEFIEAIKNNSAKVFSQRFRTSDILLVDDVQFFAGKESTQEEFFYIFNTLYQNGRQIVLTSDLPPASLKGLQDRLVSRFQWGLCVDIQPPDLETRVAILKKKAEEDNLSLPENVLYYIAENISSNIRELEGVVIRLLAFASITKSDINIELVDNILKKSFDHGKSRVSIDEIIEKVADYYKVPVNNIREKNRRKEVALCRQIAMYISKSITNHSLKTVGLHFGGRDHSTVIHAVHQIEQLKKTDESISRDINYIISMFRQ